MLIYIHVNTITNDRGVRNSMSKIITIAMHKGGVGKTAIATNLAGSFSLNGKTLIIDLDSQGNVSRSFNINQNKLEYTVNDMLLGNSDFDDIVIEVNQNLDILPSNNTLSTFETIINRNKDDYPNPYKVLENQIIKFKDKYDYIIIDTPPSTGLIHGNALTSSDYVLIPLLPEKMAVSGLIDVIDSIEIIKENINPKLEIMGVVPTMTIMHTRLHKNMVKQTQNYCDSKGIKLFNTNIPRTIKFAENDIGGVPVTLNKKSDKKLRKIYNKLYKEVYSFEGMENNE